MGEEGKGTSWLCGMDAPGIMISNKKPKIFLAASQPTGGEYAVERDRREGKEGMRGAARKISRRGREVSKHGTGGGRFDLPLFFTIRRPYIQ